MVYIRPPLSYIAQANYRYCYVVMYNTSSKRLFLLLIMAFVANVNADPNIYGIYSNMEAKNGEPSGMEMLFLNDGRAGKCDQSVLFQVAEGWPQYPELLDCCACSVKRLEFTSRKWGKFVGRVEGKFLVGEFLDSKFRVKLKKGPGFWQK